MLSISRMLHCNSHQPNETTKNNWICVEALIYGMFVAQCDVTMGDNNYEKKTTISTLSLVQLLNLYESKGSFLRIDGAMSN